MKDLISVIIPIYKVEEYLDRCIESVVNQTYKNLEIILVDDGSPDHCPYMCDEWQKKDSRIKVIHKKNGGLSDARNVGIAESRGKYIALVDSDDYIHPEMIGELYRAICKASADMAICNFLCVDEYGNLIGNNSLPKSIKSEIITGKEILSNRIWGEQGWHWVVAWPRLYSRFLFQDIYFPVGKLHEDEFTAHLFWDKCDKVACIKQAYYFYVQRSESIMNKKYSVKRLDSIEALLKRLYFMITNKYSSESIHNCYNLYYSVLVESYKRIDIKNQEVKRRYKELNKTYKKIFWSLMKQNVGIKRKSRYIINYVSPYYGVKLINRCSV